MIWSFKENNVEQKFHIKLAFISDFEFAIKDSGTKHAKGDMIWENKNKKIMSRWLLYTLMLLTHWGLMTP